MPDNIAGYTAMQFILFGFLLLFGLFVAVQRLLSSFGLLMVFYWIWYAAVFARRVGLQDRTNKQTNERQTPCQWAINFCFFSLACKYMPLNMKMSLQIDQK